MKHFVKLVDYSGAEIAWPVDAIVRVEEQSAEVTSRAHRSGCVTIYTAEREEPTWVIGTVDQVLQKIRDAQKETT